MLKIFPLTVTPFSQNARIVADIEEAAAAVVDPGGETERILSLLHKSELTCGEIWLTHSHIDHCGGVAELVERTGAVVYGHRAEAFLRSHVQEAALMFGLPPDEYRNCPEPTHYIQEGDTLSVGKYRFRVLDTPGHSPGHVAFYCEQQRIVISGDVLFRGGVGRVDLPGGDAATLRHSLREKLLTLPADTVVMSGHGPDTAVGDEIRSNPFLLTDSW